MHEENQDSTLSLAMHAERVKKRKAQIGKTQKKQGLAKAGKNQPKCGFEPQTIAFVDEIQVQYYNH